MGVPDVDNMPDELKTYPNWVLWKKVKRKGKASKAPYTANGALAGVNKPHTWTTFDKAVEAYQGGKYDGIGFVFTNTPYVGIDLDGVLEGGKLKPFAKEVIKRLGSYTELSPSSTGVHVIVKGKMPSGKRRNDGLGIEMYGESSPRYFAMTGKAYGKPKPIRHCQPDIEAIHSKYIAHVEAEATESPLPDGQSDLSDDEAIAKAGQCKNGKAFKALYYEGDLSGHNGDASAADLALCNILAFYCRKDLGQMDRIFRQSGLMRDKWDSRRGGSTYGEMTLRKAAKECREVYGSQTPSREQVLEAFSDGNLKLTPMSEIERELAEYLFYPYVPKGKLTIMAGVSGSTKTWLCLYLATVISTGGQFITDNEIGLKRRPGRVLFQTKENDYAVDVRYRLDVLGADLKNIIMLDDADIDGKGRPLTLTDPRLKTAISQQGIDLLIFDPIQSYLGAGVDFHRANEVRPVMDGLVKIAAETGCGIVLVSHLNKDGNMSALDRILGSSDLRNAARSIVFIGNNPETEGQRVLAHAKNSLGVLGKSIAYRIDGKSHGVVIDGFVEHDEDDITKPRSKATRDKPAMSLDKAKDFLLDILSETGYADLDEIRMSGISNGTLYNAKKELGIGSISTGYGFDKRAWWYVGMTREEAKKLITESELN